LRPFSLLPLQEETLSSSSSSTTEQPSAASKQARQTDPPGRASPASSEAHPVRSTPFKKMEKKNLPWLLLLLFVCFLVLCLSMVFLWVFLETFDFARLFPNFLCVFCCFVVGIVTNIAHSGDLNSVCGKFKKSLLARTRIQTCLSVSSLR
jgi:hypothetical protein